LYCNLPKAIINDKQLGKTERNHINITDIDTQIGRDRLISTTDCI